MDYFKNSRLLFFLNCSLDSISLFFTFLRKLFLFFFFTGIHQCTLRKFLLNLLFKYSIVLLCTFPIGQFRAITIHNMDSRIEELYMCIMRYTYIAKKILRIVQVFQFHFDYSSCEFYISHFLDICFSMSSLIFTLLALACRASKFVPQIYQSRTCPII